MWHAKSDRKTANIIVKNLTVTLRRCAAHVQVISSFVIFAVLDLRDSVCRPQKAL